MSVTVLQPTDFSRIILTHSFSVDSHLINKRNFCSGRGQAVEKLFYEHNILVRMCLELGSNEAIKQAVAGGLGLSIPSRHSFALEEWSGQLAVLNADGFPIQRQWHIVFLKGKQLSTVAQTLFHYLQAEAELPNPASC